MMGFKAKFVSITFILFVSVGSGRISCQDIDHSRARPESEKSIDEKTKDEELKAKILHGKNTEVDNAAEKLKKEIKLGNRTEGYAPRTTSVVRFGDLSGDQWNLNLSGSISRELSVSRLSLRGLDKLFDAVPSRDLIVFAGRIPDSAMDWIAACRRCVILSERSKSEAPEEIVSAASLPYRPFSAGNAVLLNGLPFETGSAESLAELSRMGVVNNKEGWLRANKAIRLSAESIRLETLPAEKSVLKRELQTGSRDIVFVIAHSDSRSIYLPGKDGSKLSFDELRNLKRESKPDRTVVLLVCGGGAVNQNVASIAEILLQNNLARSVLATPNRVDARDIEGRIHLLRDPANTLRDAFENLWHLVLEHHSSSDYPDGLHVHQISYPEFASRITV